MPVYSSAGRGGGWSLVGGARTDLSGLTVDEARALSSPPARPPAASRGAGGTAQTPGRAARAAAAGRRGGRLGPRRRSGVTWGRAAPPEPEHLGVLRQAVVDGRQVVLGYTGRTKPPSSRTVSPLGLVTKSGVWYLVAGTDDGVRTFRVGRVTG